MTERQLNVYDVLNRYCVVCGAELAIQPTGRPRSTCSDRCRQRRRRASRNPEPRAAAQTFRDTPAPSSCSAPSVVTKGSRRRRALALIRQRPGITVPELADELALHHNYLYRILPAMLRDGEVVKRGRGWFAAA